MNKPRLIDANKLIEWLELLCKDYEDAEAYCERNVVEYIISAMGDINTAPTAYDIDKVVEKLKEGSFNAGDFRFVNLNRAIEIVKGGAVDDKTMA